MSAHFVEVHLVHRSLVQGGLDVGQGAEDGQGALGHPSGQRGGGDEGGDVGVGAHHDIVVTAHDGPRAGHAAAQSWLDLQFPAVEVEAVQEGAYLIDVGPGIEERPQRHVTGDARETVEPGDGLGRPRRAHGRSRDTAQAAPYPLSMPTTEIPAEHEASMASRAVTPCKAAP